MIQIINYRLILGIIPIQIINILNPKCIRHVLSIDLKGKHILLSGSNSNCWCGKLNCVSVQLVDGQGGVL